MRLAALTGYKGAFERLGLRVEGDRILDAAGAPATPRQMGELQRAIESEPKALQRQPDFFSIISRPRFAELKEGYLGLGGGVDPHFKDVGLTREDRDFMHTRTCRPGLDQDCNPHAGESPYFKESFVSAQMLDDIWEGLFGDVDFSSMEAAAPAALGRRLSLGGVQGLMRSVLSGWQGLFGGGTSEGTADASISNFPGAGLHPAAGGKTVRRDGGTGAGPGSGQRVQKSSAGDGVRARRGTPPAAKGPARSTGLRFSRSMGLAVAAAFILGWVILRSAKRRAFSKALRGTQDDEEMNQ